MMISVDYKWTTYGLDEESDAYDEALSVVHLRSAGRILDGCLKVKNSQLLLCSCLFLIMINNEDIFKTHII